MKYISKGNLQLAKRNDLLCWKEIVIKKNDEFEILGKETNSIESLYKIKYNNNIFFVNWIDAEYLIQGEKIDLKKTIFKR
ncbi:hypothetical protein RSJ8_4325 (plasmid) [Clostridium botulinum]|nr:hypothetical protein [Clostridium botulinum]APH21013.1 hypothetical protein NPD1_4089 [Clostridium botulinum]APQ71360.1 hypothetical protein RSJ8_4325 [Clostridium botulinum]MBN3379095.1 hypothetical protein [Clostridium botulinum]